MTLHEDTRQEKLKVTYDLFGIGADVCQLSRAYLRGDSKGVKKNINQLIIKLQRINKKL